MDYMKKHLGSLQNGVIVGIVDDGGSPPAYGLVIMRKDNTYVIAWSLSSPRGGPGFIEVEEDGVDEGDRVVAERTITEGGEFGDTSAQFPHPQYIHAMRGDTGKIVHVEKETVTVRFDRTGTATLVRWDEISFGSEPYIDENGATIVTGWFEISEDTV